MARTLITGANGQIGTELCQMLLQKQHEVIATDVRASNTTVYLDVTNEEEIIRALSEHKIEVVYHMAAILSATGENHPSLAWNVNMNGLWNVLEAARKCQIDKVFFPSSIAVFGPNVPQENCPQQVFLNPTTLYGITKVTGELLSDYYFDKYKLDVRSIRYPGLISHAAMPGGGTTDYAVEIFHSAIKKNKYTAFVRKDTKLPMMYMPDAIRATVELMEADRSQLKTKGAYNIASLHFSLEELVKEIQKHFVDFICDYKPDQRQNYADSWPGSIDDSAAKDDWQWQPKYDLAATTSDMLEKLR